MKNESTEYTTIKINAKTARKLKRHVKKIGSTIAGYVSARIETAIQVDNIANPTTAIIKQSNKK